MIVEISCCNRTWDDFLTDDSQLSLLEAALAECMAVDRHGLRRRLRALKGRHGKVRDEAALGRLTEAIDRSRERARRREAARPLPEYPADLPVVAHRETIERAILEHQVVVIAGETGSGKTTQLPKICLGLGRGVRGLIGHTQPRRIAARSVAHRIAEELGCEPGTQVGYKVRFRDRVHPDGYVKLMTDGILLAEIQGDRHLEQYDTLIIDEAHERSLNIDFLLGYLKWLLPRRPDLKLIITSATIDTERFSRHFDDAPVIEVSGRSWPVEIRYRPLRGEDEDAQDRDMQQAILEAVDELAALGPGDILVFLPGEREIRETAEALRKHHPPHTEILPLYARLSAAEQNRVFAPHRGRRIVLATNVAETSLTVPGIRYVVDTGLARISRYSLRNKVQRLPVEKISQASANQRSGRCGRVAAGVAIRLYDEEDFLNRPPFTDPEIRRTHLAAVILQMARLGLGEVERFPFVDPPERRQINDGYRLLQELGAMDEGRRITPLGRRLARLPVDPRIGRMILEAERQGALREVLIIAAALTIQDPRERPLESRQRADELHRRFRHEESDFLSLLNLWEHYEEQRRHLSHNKLRKYCREHFLSFVRMREWHEVHSQLRTLAGELGLRSNRQPAEYEAIHRSLLAGLLGNIAMKLEDGTYQGARNLRLAIFPGSGLARKGPKWIMAGQLVETSRLYAHLVARIDPAWVEPLAGARLKRSYSEPHWEKRPAQVAAWERVTLYGLVIHPRRRVNYGPIDPEASREIFIREALVQGEFRTRAPFFRHNQRLLEEVRALEHKSRRHDVLVDEETLFAFYHERIPEGIYSGARFERWRKEAERENPRLLFLSREQLMRQDAAHISGERFPDHLLLEGVALPLHYHFEPGDAADGVTLTVPVALLNQLSPERFEWLVPGLLEEKITALLRGLPKPLRKHFVPVPDYARACVEALAPEEGGLAEALSRHLRRMSGATVAPEQFAGVELPSHLRMNFRVVAEDGEVLGEGRDLALLQRQLAGRAAAGFARRTRLPLEREGITRWDFGSLPEEVTFQQGGLTLKGHPALVDEGDSVAIRVFDTPGAAAAAMEAGLCRLFALALKEKMRYLERNLPVSRESRLQYAALGGGETLESELLAAITRRVFVGDEPPVRDPAAFERRLAHARERLLTCAEESCAVAGEILALHHRLRKRLDGSLSPAWIHAVRDMREQLSRLVRPGFVRETPWHWLQQIPRYLAAIELRLEKLQGGVERDQANLRQFRPLWEVYLSRHGRADGRDPALEEYRWLLEELRVSLFAQQLGTLRPVSIKRLSRYFD